MRLLILLLFVNGSLLAQKLPIDTGTYAQWTSVEKPEITNDGKYISYVINNQPKGGNTYVFQAVNTSWKYECQQLTSSKFTNDSKRVFLFNKDTLRIMALGTSRMETLTGVKAYQLFICEEKEWVLLSKSGVERKLIMYPIEGTSKMEFEDVTGYNVSPDGQTLLLQYTRAGVDKSNYIDWITINSGTRKTIWKGERASNFIFDRSGKKLAFYLQAEKDGNQEYLIAYFEIGDMFARKLIDDNSQALLNKLKITVGGNGDFFSRDGEYLFFSVKENIVRTPQDYQGVNIWSYTDAKLQSQQRGVLGYTPLYYSCVNVKTGKFLRLVNEDERIVTDFYPNWNDEYIVVEYLKGDINEWNWNPAAAQSTFLVSTRTGERKVIKSNVRSYLSDFELSPDGNYLIYYDSESMNYFSLNTKTGKRICISTDTKTIWSGFKASESSPNVVGFMGWLEDKGSILVQDRFDLWMLDLEGVRKSVRLTNGKEKNVIYFHAMDLIRPLYKTGETILLRSLNLNNIDQGFSKLKLKIGEEVKDIKAGPHQYTKKYISPYYNGASGLKIRKARDREIYLTIIQSPSASPNYFVTTDFSAFKEMSHVYPEKAFNWMTAELHNFPLNKDVTLKGVLYKPENFDPNHKYPIIFYYYTLESHNLNAYLQPKSTGAIINIPYLVSNGYLVFMPDIYYEKAGKTGESALNSVLAAVDYLKTKSWIDIKKMGVAGHSFGGFETNYIITHSDIFSAALSASAVSDMISEYNSIWGVKNAPGLGFSKQGLAEWGYVNMGGTLWTAKQAYIENSAVLHADRLSTPLLMMHNENDGAVSFSQGLGFFSALRRLGKRVWMLEYDKEDHIINNYRMAVDYDFRMKQFFDHYLKDAPMPAWMKKGVPASLKGIENGLSLEE